MTKLLHLPTGIITTIAPGEEELIISAYKTKTWVWIPGPVGYLYDTLHDLWFEIIEVIHYDEYVTYQAVAKYFIDHIDEWELIYD